MGPVSYVIAILGCADGGMSCQQLAVEPARYESAARCEAASADVLARSTEFDFPTIVARCERAAKPASLRGLPERRPGLQVRKG